MRILFQFRLLHGIGSNNTKVVEIGIEIQILSEDLRRVGPLLETQYPGTQLYFNTNSKILSIRKISQMYFLYVE